MNSDTAELEGHSRCLVGVEDFRVQALIGVHAHEHGRRQLLVVSVTLEVSLPEGDSLEETVDYAAVATIIDRIAGAHTRLIETFAANVARACLIDPIVKGVRVRVEKPSALTGGLACAQVKLRRMRPTPEQIADRQ